MALQLYLMLMQHHEFTRHFTNMAKAHALPRPRELALKLVQEEEVVIEQERWGNLLCVKETQPDGGGQRIVFS